MTQYFNATNDLDRLLSGLPTDTLARTAKRVPLEVPRFAAPPPLETTHEGAVAVMFLEHCTSCSSESLTYGYVYRRQNGQDQHILHSTLNALGPQMITRVERLRRNVPMCGQCLQSKMGERA